MKKLSKWLSGIFTAAVTAALTAVTVFAADDYIMFEGESASQKAWGQAVTYYIQQHANAGIKITDLKEGSKIIVEYSVNGDDNGDDIELIFQNWQEEDGSGENLWKQIQPAENSDGTAVFLYADMVSTYGTDDFSTVKAVNIGDRGTPITVTKVAIDLSGDGLSDFAEDVAETEAETEEDTAEAEETEAETEKITETTAADEETTAAEAASDEEAAPKKFPIVPIVIIGVVLVAGVVVFFVIKSRNKYY